MTAPNRPGEPDEGTIRRAAEDLVAFFRGLPEERARDYRALADLDLRFGEDVVAERRAGADGAR